MFARLYDTTEGQVLVTKEFDEERGEDDGAYRILFRCEPVGGVDCSVSFGWHVEANRDNVFDAMRLENAQEQGSRVRTFARNFIAKGQDK